LRFSLALVFAFAAVLSGCGSSSPSPESVARAWSQELNSGDNAAAAKLFAPGAEIVQAGTTIRLNTQAEAVAWNEALPCSGRIVAMKTHDDTATATFELGDRQQSKCDGPGQQVTAIFRVHRGKIVLWHQTTSEEPVGPTI